MIFCGYGVKLERLKQADIELVREKRNSVVVSQFMHYREEITPEMQKVWFASIDNVNNMYYIIHYNEKKIGVVNGAQIDWEKRETGSGGIFVWEQGLWETEIPLMANLLMIDLSLFLGLYKTYIKVLPSNYRAIKYNAMLGYRILPNQENEPNQAYVLDMEKYLENTYSLRNYLYKQYGDVFDVVVDDPEHPVTQFMLQKLKAVPLEYLKRLNFIYP